MTTIDKHTPGTVSWVDLGSGDPDRSRAFFTGLFGWTYEDSGPEMGHYALAKLDGRYAAGIGPLPPGGMMPPAWSVYFATDDLDATVARVRDNMGAVIAQMDVAQEGRMAMFADPTGAMVSAWQPRRHHGAQIADVPGAMTWFELTTRDAAKACAFYASVFGLEAKPDGDAFTLHRGAKTVARVTTADGSPRWTAFFAVADVDAATARVTELGGSVHAAPADSPAGRASVVSEPSGAVFSLVAKP